MNTTYQQFCERLKQERNDKKLSQLEIGQILRMSQSHYSKVEWGTRRLTFYETQYLCESIVDTYYIFNGERCEETLCNDFLGYSYEDLSCCLNVLCLLLANLRDKKLLELSNELSKKIENIQLVLISNKKGKTLFYKLRRALNYSQIQMADLIQVDVKKLRNLESGKVLPDNEIMLRMSELFCIPYALHMKSTKGLACEISKLLGILDEKRRLYVRDNLLSFCEASNEYSGDED